MFWVILTFVYFVIGSISLAIFVHNKWIDVSNMDDNPSGVFALLFWPIAWFIFICAGFYYLTINIIEKAKLPKINITK